MDEGASSPARCRVSNLRFEPSAVSPSAKPENPLGFQPSCHPYQFLLKSFRFPGAKTARKRFLLWKMGFSGAKIVPCPPYTPLGTIESSKGLRPSRALPGARRGRIPLRTTLSQIPLKSCGFPGAESARKRFFLRGASPRSEKISARGRPTEIFDFAWSVAKRLACPLGKQPFRRAGRRPRLEVERVHTFSSSPGLF